MRDQIGIFAKQTFAKIAKQALDNALAIFGTLLVIFLLVMAGLWDWTYWSEQTIRNGVVYEVKLIEVESFSNLLLSFLVYQRSRLRFGARLSLTDKRPQHFFRRKLQ